MRVKNNTLDERVWVGQTIQPGDYYTIDRVDLDKWQSDYDVEQSVLASELIVATPNVDITDPQYGLDYLRDTLESSVAIDKDGTDQIITSTSWEVVTCDRILWDVSGDYDIVTHDFIVPFNGIYGFDIQMKVKDLVDIESVELAIFQRGTPDDYWFIIDKMFVNGYPEVQLSGATLFDFRQGERYCLKIIATASGPAPSYTVSGDDDFTAWGYDYRRQYE